MLFAIGSVVAEGDIETDLQNGTDEEILAAGEPILEKSANVFIIPESPYVGEFFTLYGAFFDGFGNPIDTVFVNLFQYLGDDWVYQGSFEFETENGYLILPDGYFDTAGIYSFEFFDENGYLIGYITFEVLDLAAGEIDTANAVMKETGNPILIVLLLLSVFGTFMGINRKF